MLIWNWWFRYAPQRAFGATQPPFYYLFLQTLFNCYLDRIQHFCFCCIPGNAHCVLHSQRVRAAVTDEDQSIYAEQRSRAFFTWIEQLAHLSHRRTNERSANNRQWTSAANRFANLFDQ